MIEDLKKLIRLQSVDLAIRELRERIEKFPAESKALDILLANAQTHLEKTKERSKQNLTGRKKLEGDVGMVQAKISKHRDQLMKVKTNEEYKAMLKEIEYDENEIRKIEDQILHLMLEGDALEKDVKAAEVVLKEDQRKVDVERAQLTRQNGEDKQALEAYLSERSELEGTVSGDLLFRYERIRKARGIAVAPAVDETCQVCNVRMRPQTFQEIRRNDQIITCEQCSRILYSPENMDHPFEVA